MIELSKECLYEALKRQDSYSGSIYCIANVYLAVLHFTTGHLETAIHCCEQVMSRQTHSECGENQSLKVQMPIAINMDTELYFLVLLNYTVNTGYKTCRIGLKSLVLVDVSQLCIVLISMSKIKSTTSARHIKSYSTTDFQPTLKFAKSTISTKTAGLVRFQNQKQIDRSPRSVRHSTFNHNSVVHEKSWILLYFNFRVLRLLSLQPGTIRAGFTSLWWVFSGDIKTKTIPRSTYRLW